MIREQGVPGALGKVVRYTCAVCGEHYDAVRVDPRDIVDHHCPTARTGAWWILRRAAA